MAGPPITPWVNGSNAVFSATGLNAIGNFTVTLATSVTVGDLTYTGGGLGSTLQIAAAPATNTITIAASPMHVMVDPFTTLVVAANIAGVGGQLVLEANPLLFTPGTLVLTGSQLLFWRHHNLVRHIAAGQRQRDGFNRRRGG